MTVDGRYAGDSVLLGRPPVDALPDLPPEWREALAPEPTPEGLTAEALGKLALVEQLRLSALEDLGLAEQLSRGSARTGALLVDDAGRLTDARHLLREQTGSPASAARDVRVAHGLAHLPEARAAVRDGRLTMASACVVALDVVPLFEAHLPAVDVPAALAEADEHLVRFAAGSADPGGLRDLVRDWLIDRHPHAVERQDEAARLDRVVRHRNLGDGRFRTTVETDALGHELIRTALSSADARPEGVDRRSRGQREHDVLLDVLGHALGCTRTATPARQVVVTADLQALTDAATGPATGRAVGRWTGRLSREQVEQLCCDATTALVLLGPDGQARAVTSSTRDIPPSMRLAALARDESRCRRRGCRSRRCLELHHIVAVRDGGRSVITNLVHLCLRCHTLWHLDRVGVPDLDIPWTPSNDPPGAAPP